MATPKKSDPETIKALFDSGLSSKEIATKLSVSRQRVDYVLHSVLGINRDNHGRVINKTVSNPPRPEPTLSLAMLHLAQFDSILRDIVHRQKKGGEAFAPPPGNSAARSIQPNLNFHTQQPVERSRR